MLFSYSKFGRRLNENKLQKELFAREVDMMYKIRHPNIVRLYTHFEDESNCYIALEYIKKGNLYSYTQSMPNKVLDAATTAHFVVDLISSLYYLHNMNPPGFENLKFYESKRKSIPPRQKES